VDGPLDHVHADASARERSDFFGGRKARRENELVELLFGELGVRRDDPVLLRLGADARMVEAGTVVGHRDGDFSTGVDGREPDRTLGRLALADADGRVLETMVDRVADEV